ncbi:MAG: biotin/lipoyl-containing protein [Thermoanaerobaculum sp.]
MIRCFRLADPQQPVKVRVVSGNVEVEVGDQRFHFQLELSGPGGGFIHVEGKKLPLFCARLRPGVWQLFFGGQEHTVVLEDPLRASPRPARGHDGQEELVAPIPGRVVQVLVPAGAEVAPGTPVVVLEAMKMQNLIATQVAGRVREVRVAPGATVEAGQVLAVVG